MSTTMHFVSRLLMVLLCISGAGCTNGFKASKVFGDPEEIVSPSAKGCRGKALLAPPTNLNATSTDTSVTLTWTESTSTGVVSYVIFRDGSQISLNSSSPFLDSGLLPLTTYQYSISAKDVCGKTSLPAVISIATLGQPPPPTIGEEFIGPFASWSNVKTKYGAKGDGVTDDTLAIQTGLSELAKSGVSPVLYFPAGNYKITSTLNLIAKIGVSILGEHPQTTTISWHGAPGERMFSINGMAYSKFSRFTLDAKSVADIIVDQSWDGVNGYFDTGNEYSDINFIDAGYGIRGGHLGYGFAETAVQRAHFIRNSKAGIILRNYNALDLWVWDSLFDSCYRGITNEPGAGNFRVYRSNFLHSTDGDMVIGNTGVFSVRNNFSLGSRAFFFGYGSNNPSPTDIQGNVIIDSTQPYPIMVGNQGPGLVYDNVIRSLPGSTGAVVWASFSDADMLSLGNTYTVANPTYSGGRLISVDDQIVSPDSITYSIPQLPEPLPNMNRMVFEIPLNASADTIQAIINQAMSKNGHRCSLSIWNLFDQQNYCCTRL